MAITAFLGRRLNLGVVHPPLWALGLAAVYWLWPLDLVADNLPFGVGLWDDLVVAALLVLGTGMRD